MGTTTHTPEMILGFFIFQRYYEKEYTDRNTQYTYCTKHTSNTFFFYKRNLAKYIMVFNDGESIMEVVKQICKTFGHLEPTVYNEYMEAAKNAGVEFI